MGMQLGFIADVLSNETDENPQESTQEVYECFTATDREVLWIEWLLSKVLSIEYMLHHLITIQVLNTFIYLRAHTCYDGLNNTTVWCIRKT